MIFTIGLMFVQLGALMVYRALNSDPPNDPLGEHGCTMILWGVLMVTTSIGVKLWQVMP